MIHNVEDSSSRRDALSELLWVTTLMSDDMQRGLEAYGLTQARAHIIWELGTAQRLTQRELAEALKVTPRNITALVDALEKTGFVRRTDHPTDRRAILVVLTEKGQGTAARLQSEMTAFSELLFGRVSEHHLDRFRRILRDIGTRLSELAQRAARVQAKSRTAI
jgi:DNA-binding MarR family transcriptional regulator